MLPTLALIMQVFAGSPSPVPAAPASIPAGASGGSGASHEGAAASSVGTASARALAPTAPELQVVEARLGDLLGRARAVGAATSRLQTAWTRRKAPLAEGARAPIRCQDVVSLDLGWRAERFGTAWREVAQAVRVEAERLHAFRFAPTVAPLVEGAWGARLDALERAAAREALTLREAGAWQERYVRPWLAECPVPLALAAPGESRRDVAVRAPGGAAEPRALVAILGYGVGQVCVEADDGLRAVGADDGVVFVPVLDGRARACWSPDTACTCILLPVEPGAALGAGAEESDGTTVPAGENPVE